MCSVNKRACPSVNLCTCRSTPEIPTCVSLLCTTVREHSPVRLASSPSLLSRLHLSVAAPIHNSS